MSRLRPWLVVGIALLMAAALVGLVFSEHRARAEGTEVRLAIEGVDPRSLLSGHYVALNFTDRLPKGVGCIKMLGERSPDTWIALRTREGLTRVVAEAPTREAALRLAPIAVKGSLRCFGLPEEERVTLDIGIDRFHASQTEALAIEAALRNLPVEEAKAFALVSVGRDGNARLLGLEVEGKRIMLDWVWTTD